MFGSGCSSWQVGESEFSCPNEGNGAACSSARQIHDLTNNRNSLEGFNVSNGVITSRSDGNPIKDSTSSKHDHDDDDEDHKPTKMLTDNGRAKNEVYKPLDTKRYDAFPQAEKLNTNYVKGLNPEHERLMLHNQAPMALAPEPLAVLQQPKTMRVLVSSWTDKSGDLHMPGYVYVEVEPKKWLVGEQANIRPSRVVPLQIQKITQEESRRQKESKKGFSSLGITEK